MTGPQSVRPAAPIVVEPDPRWPAIYAAEARAIAHALQERVVSVHHIGSTAIPGICAKPVIDILLETRDVAALDGVAAGMHGLGYEGLGEYGIPRRRYFRKGALHGARGCHVHAYATGDPHVIRHLAFRDYMRAHPDVAAEYDALKRRLSAGHPADKTAYVDGKAPYVAAWQALALEWAGRIEAR